MRRFILMAAGLAPIALTLLAFAALASAAPHFQEGEEPTASACEPGLYKTVTPDSLLLGQSAKVTLVMTHTCPSGQTPIDIMFVVDESNSMTRATGSPGGPDPGDPGRTPTVDPRPTPPRLLFGDAGLSYDLLAQLPSETLQDPGPGPGPGPGDPSPGPGPGGGDPPGCGGNDASGPGAPPGPEPPPGPGPGPGPVPLTAAERSALSGMSGAIVPALRDGDSPNQPTREPTVDPRATATPRGGGDTGEPAGTEDNIRDVRNWLNDFIDDERIQADIDSGNLRLGMVAFNARARTIVKLSEFDQAHRVASLASRLNGQDETRIDMGFQRALTELGGTTRILGGREGRKQFVVILSDGAFCLRDLRRVRESREIQIATVTFGRSGWEHRLNDLASERRFAFTSRDLESFLEIYRNELSSASTDEIERLVFEDELRENMQLVPGSVVPPPSGIDGQTIRWDALRAGADITTTPRITIAPVITLTYEIEPQEPGSHFVSYDAIARWRDTQGLPGLGVFPPVVIDVIPPTPTPTHTSAPTNTPTSTSTPTATPTPQPLPRYFPVAFKEAPKPDVCIPELQSVDIALVVDTSSSMTEIAPGTSETKLAAAIDAAKVLVGLLKLPDTHDGDQATVIGFNSEPSTISVLSGDRAVIESALDALAGTSDTGTHIDKGLNAAVDELESERGRPDSRASIILVTDGRHSGPGGSASVLIAAERARGLGLIVFTVGLGSDIDADLLRMVATVPENYRAAPDPSDLKLIYEAIVREIPCP